MANHTAPTQPAPVPAVASPTVPLCQICGVPVVPTTVEWIWAHARGSSCAAELVGEDGSSLDERFYVASDGNIYERPREPAEKPPVPPEEVVQEQDGVVEEELPDLPTVPEKKPRTKKKTEARDVMIPTGPDPTVTPVDEGLELVFKKHDLPRLGGASGPSGWSSFSTYQRCPYLFKVTYLDGGVLRGPAPAALEIGSLVHAFLAVDGQRKINQDYPLDSKMLYEGVLEMGCDGERCMEAWRIYQGYAVRYENDYLVPLAVEYLVKDEKTRESARYDMIAKVLEPVGSIPAGTYIVEAKTASRFDDATLDGWRNDGEIIGQMMLWNRKHLSKKFGKLAGVIVDIIGKQKIQRFERVVIAPQRWQMTQHTSDLRVWQSLRQLSLATKSFPRARANCLGRYGKCPLWDRCAERSK